MGNGRTGTGTETFLGKPYSSGNDKIDLIGNELGLEFESLGLTMSPRPGHGEKLPFWGYVEDAAAEVEAANPFTECLLISFTADPSNRDAEEVVTLIALLILVSVLTEAGAVVGGGSNENGGSNAGGNNEGGGTIGDGGTIGTIGTGGTIGTIGIGGTLEDNSDEVLLEHRLNSSARSRFALRKLSASSLE